MSDLHELTVFDQLAALRSGEVSSRDLTEHYLERIDRLGDELGAFVTVTADLARAEADAADGRLADGDPAPLLGLPLGIKDMHATAGVRTTLGSAALNDLVPTEDSWTVGLLRQAGGVLVGKTSSAELGATCFTHHALTGAPAVTPYGTGRYASGSSGGAAAAVAAGLLPFGHASDGAGSTRTPAATSHLIGVKPSRGLVSSAPAVSFLSAGTEGPIARTVTDAALLLDVMAQAWSGDLYGWGTERPFVDALDVQRPLRIATWTDTGIPGVDPHPESVRAVARTVALLRDLGHDVVEISPPATYDEQVRLSLVGLFACGVGLAARTVVPASQVERMSAYSRWLVEQFDAQQAQDVLVSQGVLARFAAAHLAALAPFDVTLTPTTNGPPVPVGHFHLDGVEHVADRMLAWSCYTPFANLTGQPAVAIPTHLDADGLPHSVQLVGRPRRDAEVLALASQLERAGLWSDVHPPCWQR